MSLILIDIQRKEYSSKAILGEMKVTHPFGSQKPFPLELYTLELPYADNLNDLSSIPPGNYPAFIRTDGHRGWRLELRNVPHRRHIQIHKGNTTNDILGCILVGTTKGSLAVYNSKRAMDLLKKEIEQTPGNKDIQVKIR
jgi:hypothetical protein